MDTKENAWIVSSSPHAHSGDSVQKIMLAVVLALTPATLMSVYFFGWHAVRLLVVCSLGCTAAEAASRKWMRRDIGIADGSALVTGILLALNLPPSLPSWMALIGCVVSVVIAKQVYGGIGYNPFNPALVGRAFLLVSFPLAMTTTWLTPTPLGSGLDAVTAATPLGLWKTSWSTGVAPAGFFEQFPVARLFVGARPGCIGEGSVAALLIGGIYLLWRQCIRWQIPVCYMGTVAVFSGLLWALDPERNLSPLYHLLTGGLVLGAVFMATDMVTSPITGRGMALFGVGCGILTVVIRKWGGYPEGVSFAILIMNAATPLINRATRPRVFGHRRSGAGPGAGG